MRYDDNLTADRATFVTHLECSITGERYEADMLHGLSQAGRPLLVRYDLDAVRAVLTKDVLAGRPPTCGAIGSCCPFGGRRMS